MRAVLEPSLISGSVKIPPSKSMAHRAILCAGLSRGFSRIYNLEYSKDIAATIGGIRQLGAIVQPSERSAEIEGKGGFATVMRPIQCGESGSTLRFLIPLASLTGQEVSFTGAKRLFERPHNVYKEIFTQRSLHFNQSVKNITIQGALTAGEYIVPGNVSSQFISGLLFAMPLMRADSTIHITPPFESRSYINLTLSALQDFNIKAEYISDDTIKVYGNQLYYPCEYTVEGDYSQGAFFAVLGSVLGDVEINGLRHTSMQGDKAILDILKRCNAKFSKTQDGYHFNKSTLSATEIDLADCPDLGPILMVLGTFCKGDTVIHNASRLRLKECDRISAMEEELTKLGGKIHSEGSDIFISKAKLHTADDLSSHNDHRIAMALSIAALAAKIDVKINGAEAVAKSYPDFFDDLYSIGAKVELSDE